MTATNMTASQLAFTYRNNAEVTAIQAHQTWLHYEERLADFDDMEGRQIASLVTQDLDRAIRRLDAVERMLMDGDLLAARMDADHAHRHARSAYRLMSAMQSMPNPPPMGAAEIDSVRRLLRITTRLSDRMQGEPHDDQ